jgi:hypothetical protein
MSAHTEPHTVSRPGSHVVSHTDSRAASHTRSGFALLLAVVIAAVVGIGVLALWRSTAAATRAISLEASTTRSDAVADSARTQTMMVLDSGGWRLLHSPGDWRLVASDSTRVGRWRAEIGRIAWGALIVRGLASAPGGVRSVSTRADHRTIVPLVSPIPFPDAALTGVAMWSIDPAALVDIPVAAGREHLCRAVSGARASARAPLPRAIDSIRLPVIDPDTLRDSVVGAFRLATGRIRTPVRVTGMLVVDTELVVEADLRVTGVLVARGSVRPAGGRLDVTGAAVSGDAGGGTSALGPGDRVRYDACAIRSALEHVTSRGPTATWTTLNVF